MRTLSFLLQKEFKQIFRDPAILRLIFLMPMIQLLLLPWAADYEIKNIDVAIVDLDRSVYSQRLIDKIQYSSYFKLQVYALSYKDAHRYIEDETVDLILEIPDGFERDLTREDESNVFIAVNAINGTMGEPWSCICRSNNSQVESKYQDGMVSNAKVVSSKTNISYCKTLV